MKKVAVIGATGYTGQELLRLLLQHGRVEVHSATSKSYTGQQFTFVYPGLSGFTDLTCEVDDVDKLAAEVDVIFLALPHGQAAFKISQQVLEKCKVIDLGADFRLKNAKDYDLWYELTHPQPELLKTAVYGLPELFREEIKGASLVATPGCYAACSILTVAPLLKNKLIDIDSIVIDAKSGVSGAGRSLALDTHFNECNESLKAYKVGCHRHVPEIEQVLLACSGEKVVLSFTPHLVPMNRGILVTAYARLRDGVDLPAVEKAYKEAFKNEPFVRLCKSQSDFAFPETRWVKGSNFCDIGFTIDYRTNRVIAIGALDNLVKGAAGQAIQNMNLLFGFEETTGLKQIPLFP
jgi:N-acetyl-gamma-glutamyl-phosphate reductase